MAEISLREQADAAASLGMVSLDYMDYEDGYLIPDVYMRKQVTGVVRNYYRKSWSPALLQMCFPTIITSTIPTTAMPDRL